VDKSLASAAMASASSPWERLILQRAPVEKIMPLLDSIPNWPSYESQTDLVNILTSDANHTPPSRWLKYFLKCVHDKIEKSNEEVHDSIAEMIVQSSQLSEDDAGTVIFPLPNDQKAYIHAKKIHNQVGMRLWTAGIFLSDFMLQLPFCHERYVLELGAGTGCTGILLALSTKLKKIIMTDFHPEVIDNLRHNIDFNSHLSAALMSCETLDWAYFTQDDISNLLDELPHPVILAADCIYSIDLGVSLVNILCHILFAALEREQATSHSLDEFLASLSSSPSLLIPSPLFPYALIVQTVRQEETFTSFMNYLELTLSGSYRGIIGYRDITDWVKQNHCQDTQLLYYDKSEDVRVICLYPIGVQNS
jgi:SAM-dependent methyltransferase